MYPAELVKPMREDLTNVGFEELHTVEAVDAAMAKEGTTLVVSRTASSPHCLGSRTCS